MPKKRVAINLARDSACYYEYIGKSKEDKAVADWIDARVKGLVKPNGQPIRILGIGSGNGVKDARIAEKVSQKCGQVYNCSVEPDKNSVEEFQKLVVNKIELAQVQFDFKTQTEEDYRKSGEAAKFDLIHMLMVLYAVDDIESTIIDYYNNYLKPGGAMVIMMEHEQNIRSKVVERYAPLLPKYENAYMNGNANGKTIEDILKKRGFNYRRTTLPSTVSLHVGCDHECGKSCGLLLDFITGVDSTSEKTPDVVTEFVAKGKASIQKGDKVTVNYDLAAFVIESQ
ncbi:histamine N-methyltransferase-like [Ptychodera flava]|uniref:histamine N-methyltransferase-like n=1 Tax=Ptychodera flava TaxID=63121 RepID=UPI003969BDCA